MWPQEERDSRVQLQTNERITRFFKDRDTLVVAGLISSSDCAGSYSLIVTQQSFWYLSDGSNQLGGPLTLKLLVCVHRKWLTCALLKFSGSSCF
jgi:hypothetical protein